MYLEPFWLRTVPNYKFSLMFTCVSSASQSVWYLLCKIEWPARRWCKCRCITKICYLWSQIRVENELEIFRLAVNTSTSPPQLRGCHLLLVYSFELVLVQYVAICAMWAWADSFVSQCGVGNPTIQTGTVIETVSQHSASQILQAINSRDLLSSVVDTISRHQLANGSPTIGVHDCCQDSSPQQSLRRIEDHPAAHLDIQMRSVVTVNVSRRNDQVSAAELLHFIIIFRWSFCAVVVRWLPRCQRELTKPGTVREYLDSGTASPKTRLTRVKGHECTAVRGVLAEDAWQAFLQISDH